MIMKKSVIILKKNVKKISIKEEKNRPKKYNNNIGKKMKKSKREK